MPDAPNQFRKHVRLSGFDYRDNYAYFVTICTGHRECVFGDVIDGALRPSRRGLVVTQCWQDIPKHHPFVELDAFVVMPNHIHGILLFTGGREEATQASQLQTPPRVAATPASPRPANAHGPMSKSLGAVVGSFKAAISRSINRLRPGAAVGLWQPNYYEHVIRNDRARDAIGEYILSNPDRWNLDEENPAGGGTDRLSIFLESLKQFDRPLVEGDAGVAATGGT
jgi:putative transposase